MNPRFRTRIGSSPLRWLGALAVFLTVSALSLRRYYPPLPSPLTVELLLESRPAGTNEPLLVTGRGQAGDFLFVRHLDAEKIAFGYENWGHPGLISPPVDVPRDRRIRLQIESPGLTQIRGILSRHTDRLRLVANGAEVFNTPVDYFVRLPAEVQFAHNPLGGTACDGNLHGTLRLLDGRELRGYPAALFSLRERIVGWITISRWQALCALLLGVATFVFWERLQWRELVHTADSLARGGRVVAHHRLGGQLAWRLWQHRWFLGTAAVCSFCFAWMVSYGTFRMIYEESFGTFFDFQAVSLLQGRLDVPDEAISGEAFIVDGKRYGYFGLTPALLRLPFVIFDVYFGQVTRPLMLGYYVVALFASYGILRVARRLGGRNDNVPPPWMVVTFVGSAGLGSTIFFLGSRAYVYHEAILCGVMFALLGCWTALRHLAHPEKRWWLGSLLFGVLSVHARPPVGFFALTFLGCVAVALMLKHRAAGTAFLRRHVMVGALCGFGVFSFNIVSYLKFRTFEGCPLRFNVQYDAARLARIDGKQFHLVNLPIAIDSYLVRPNFRLEPGFPYFFIGDQKPGREWLSTKIDYHDNTLGFPYAMPGLFFLATLGGIAACVRVPSLRGPVVTTCAAGIPMSFAMFTAIAITHRYTADFTAFLVTAAAFGIVGLEACPPVWHRVGRAVLWLTLLAAIPISLATTLHYQGSDVWGVPDGVQEKYVALRRSVDAVVQALRR